MPAYHSNTLSVDDLRGRVTPVAVVLGGRPEGAATSLRMRRLDDGSGARPLALRPIGAPPPHGAVLQRLPLIKKQKLCRYMVKICRYMVKIVNIWKF